MNKIILTLLIAVCSMVSAQKIATIDMERAYKKYYKTIHAENSLKQQVGVMEDRAIGMERRHKSMIAEYETLRRDSLNVLLSEDARKQKKTNASKKQEDIRKIEGAMRSFNKNAQQVLSKKHESSRKNILSEIQNAIKVVSGEMKFGLVLDISGKTTNNIPCVIYSKNDLEITSTVLAILNKGNEKIVKEWEEKQKKKTEDKKKTEENK